MEVFVCTYLVSITPLYSLSWWHSVKNPPAMQEMQEAWVQTLGREDPLEDEMAIQSSIHSWETPRTEEPGRLLSIGSQRV